LIPSNASPLQPQLFQSLFDEADASFDGIQPGLRAVLANREATRVDTQRIGQADAEGLPGDSTFPDSIYRVEASEAPAAMASATIDMPRSSRKRRRCAAKDSIKDPSR
jgi:hypothetical protein